MMEILEEEQLEEYKCPQCNSWLEFSHNEFKQSWKLQALLPWGKLTTGNGWFECDKCKKAYLIKDYALDMGGEHHE